MNMYKFHFNLKLIDAFKIKKRSKRFLCDEFGSFTA